MTVVARAQRGAENAPGDMKTDEERRLELAVGLAEEALDAYQELLTPDTRLVLRAALVADLLDTPSGQELLRSVEADPVVGKSGDVSKVPERDEGTGNSNTG